MIITQTFTKARWQIVVKKSEATKQTKDQNNKTKTLCSTKRQISVHNCLAWTRNNITLSWSWWLSICRVRSPTLRVTLLVAAVACIQSSTPATCYTHTQTPLTHTHTHTHARTHARTHAHTHTPHHTTPHHTTHTHTHTHTHTNILTQRTSDVYHLWRQR